MQIDEFYSYLAHFDFFTDLSEKRFQPTELEEDLQRKNSEKSVQSIFEPIPIRFSSEKNYIAIWKKLFFQEAKAQIIRSRLQELGPSEELEIVSFSEADRFKVLNLKRVHPSKNTYHPSQLVVLTPKKPIEYIKQESYPNLIGVTEYSDGKVRVKVVFDDYRFGKEDFNFMNSTKRWYIKIITSLTTLERTFRALRYFEKVQPEIRQILLRPDQHNQELEKKFVIPKALDQNLLNVFNQSQYSAIIDSLKQKGVTLIQGPPGTGKTKTVLGTLSVLLSSQARIDDDDDEELVLTWKKSREKIQQQKLKNPWLKAGFEDWRDQGYLNDFTQLEGLQFTKKYLKSEQTDRKTVLLSHSQTIETPGKVLICGPSNAAVDQIIRKLIEEKLFDKDGKKYLPKFTRVGQNYDQSLSAYALQEMAVKQCNKNSQSDMSTEKNKILKDSKLVFGTLSSVGHQTIYSSNIQFDTVIIDEAGQSIQIENLVPLMYGCKRLILIGDPNQLPATVFSQIALDYKYDQSLFERLSKCGYRVQMLREQYRMHPQISHVVGKHFYGGQLVDACLKSPPGISGKESDNFAISAKYGLPSSFVMVHLDGSSEEKYKKSFRNRLEAQFILNLCQYVEECYGKNSGKSKKAAKSKNQETEIDVGVVSPYSQQVSLISGQSKTIEEKLQSSEKDHQPLQIKTIDSFQGREKNMIILSTVRSRFYNNHLVNHKKTIGFVNDLRRINVSLSRSRDVCVIVGDLKRLCLNKTWKEIIYEAMSEGNVFEGASAKGELHKPKQMFQMGSSSTNFKNKYLLKKFTESE